ncbi:hypothetical protein BDW02DRAFT_623383 [Decorospora gaudefroyi]|uniref:Uncharacterized protein n=1 Tax=Decorospora gaudefroyi TaxID=184978 RepID=A0A6A5KBG8_9PLEO|nr:hypothetical protein BDW02DRAFT_623383 [Decorospora gaudefroyi]
MAVAISILNNVAQDGAANRTSAKSMSRRPGGWRPGSVDCDWPTMMDLDGCVQPSAAPECTLSHGWGRRPDSACRKMPDGIILTSSNNTAQENTKLGGSTGAVLERRVNWVAEIVPAYECGGAPTHPLYAPSCIRAPALAGSGVPAEVRDVKEKTGCF